MMLDVQLSHARQRADSATAAAEVRRHLGATRDGAGLLMARRVAAALERRAATRRLRQPVVVPSVDDWTRAA